MRIRAIGASVTGALALCALAVPAAQADGGYGDTTITKVVVDGDNKVVVGTSGAVTVKVSVTAKDDSGIADAAYISLEGPDYGYYGASKPTCTAVSSTTSTCTGTVKIDPKVDFLSNANAGTWYVSTWIDANDDDFITADKAASFKFQRAAKLTANATPEPVKKGKTITVTGNLTRANWESLKYSGYGSQSVKLQFRKKNSSTYTTLKTIKGTSTGALKTTTKATADGYYRFSFAGNGTTGTVSSTGDLIDVK
ncbi:MULTISPECIES: calcium-binding protein [unclassified Streptomyces]|uniref:calcium-binding protein n=1 Tax=unclassified Streptomyces TaxID=2593676 RepID=UPI00371EF63A